MSSTNNFNFFDIIKNSRKYYQNICTNMNNLTKTKVYNLNDIKRYKKYRDTIKYADFVFYPYLILEIYIMFASQKQNEYFSLRKKRINPILRIFLVNELYYLYFIYNFKEEIFNNNN
jgi:hypothetical protein